MLGEHEKLIAMSSVVDYDVDVFSRSLEVLLTEQKDMICKFMEKVTQFNKELRDEEMIAASKNGRGNY